MSIPLPRQQHWAKLRMGQPVNRPPLPKKYTGDATVTLQLTGHGKAVKSRLLPKDDGELPPPPGKERPARLPDPPRSKGRFAGSLYPLTPSHGTKSRADASRSAPEHSLVSTARYQLVQADKRWLDNGLVWTKGKHFPIGVAPENIERACLFLNALLRAIERRGYRVEVGEGKTEVHIGYQPLPILLREKTKRVLPTDRKSSWTTFQLVPTGRVHLHMTYQGKERDWGVGDGAVPDEAEAMVDRLVAASERIDEYYRKLEEGWAIMRERQRVEQERKDRQAAELTGFKKLLQAATRWQQAQFIRSYLAALEASGKPLALPTDLLPAKLPACSDPSYLIWAHAKADWYDPLTENPDEWLVHINRDTLS